MAITQGLVTVEFTEASEFGDLPQVALDAPDAAPERAPRAAAERPRVLLVEDDLVIADLIIQVLRYEGLDVVHVADGQAAVDAATQQAPDLVLMDLMLPIMGGAEASRRIRERARATGQRVPIVAMSAGVNLRASATELPVDGVLAKPFDLDELVAVVNVHLRDDS